MTKLIRFSAFAVLLTSVLMLPSAALCQSPVTVQYTEGVVHGFLVLSTLDGKALAEGDVTQFARGDRVTSHTILRFKDGSINEETVVFSQRRTFRLISDHQVQKGPAFKQPMDVSVDGLTGQVTVIYTDDSGKEKTVTDRLKLPPNVSNGMVLYLLKNIRPDVPLTTLSMAAAAPKPRLVKLQISPEGEDSFSAGGSSHKATRYVVKVDIGGVAGVVAPLVGKQPQDTHVWILGGDAPSFVKSEGPLYNGGPIWRIELTSPVWHDH
ncbi:MAG TPA: hypothetical protein VK703_06860 [Candidatus Acidoferrales bacterium]|jgi:hypothetical protein|nr:hypothetical protein [Candidatus Acidoferrales bacterium]